MRKTDACSQCKALDEKVFKVKEMMPGENAPPMHPYCHCSVAAHMDDSSYQEWLNGYKNHGLDFESWQQLTAQGQDGKIQLEENELSALMKYKSSESFVINDLLRSYKEPEKLPDREKQFVNHLDSALSKMPNYEGNLIRTVDFSDYPDQEERLEKYVEQFSLDDNIDIYQYWSASKEKGYNNKSKVRIYIQKSKKAKDISGFGLDEKEVLYERNSRFHVLSKELHKGIWYILLEEV